MVRALPGWVASENGISLTLVQRYPVVGGGIAGEVFFSTSYHWYRSETKAHEAKKNPPIQLILNV